MLQKLKLNHHRQTQHNRTGPALQDTGVTKPAASPPAWSQGTHHGTVAAWPYERDTYKSSTVSQGSRSLPSARVRKGWWGCVIYIPL